MPDSVGPYISASLNWVLGKRSNLSLSYLHNVVPSDVFDAVGQQADRVIINFSYDITHRITVHLASTYTHSTYTQELLQGGIPGFQEDDLIIDTGLSYQINTNFSIEGGYVLSDISSQENQRDYTRNQVYIGVRGTY